MRLTAWCPFAIRTEYPFPTGPYSDTEHYKVIWHKTQGHDNVLEDVYPKTRGVPKFTILRTGALHQHYNMNHYDRALKNQAGGVQTNLDGAVSIELVGFVGKGSTKAQLATMTKLSAWLTAQGIAIGWMNGAPMYGEDHGRLSQKAWDNGTGHGGHIDVPENNHTDPKLLKAERLAIEAGWSQGDITMTPRAEWFRLYNQADPLVSNSVVEEVQDFLKHAAVGPDGQIKRYFGYTTTGRRGEITDTALMNWKRDTFGYTDPSNRLGAKGWAEMNRQLFMVHVSDPIPPPPPPTDCSQLEDDLETCEASRAHLTSIVAAQINKLDQIKDIVN